jgi:hypothetical protein
MAAEAGSDDRMRIGQAYRLLFGRQANDAEVQFGIEFLTAAGPPETGQASATAESPAAKSALTRWEQYAQVLLSANEFTFVD